MSDDETKTPNEIPEEALAAKKAPEFDLKDPTKRFQKIIDAIPEGTTRRQKMVKWWIGLIITLTGSVAYPVGTGVSTYADRKAERETAIRTKKADSENQRRRMQADLLKRIFVVAEKATLDNPTSIFQLGLIAQMVNENKPAFGIKLADAERTMKRMFDGLAPVAGLRRRLAESGIITDDLQTRQDQTRFKTKRVKETIKKIKAKLVKMRYRGNHWYRKKLERDLKLKEGELDVHHMAEEFYEKRLKQEEQIKSYFATELKRQEETLKSKLQQTTLLRDRLKRRTERFTYLMVKLQSHSKATQDIAKKLRSLMLDIEEDNEKTHHTIKRLTSELESERSALNAAKDALQRNIKALRWCINYKKKSLFPTLPLPCPLDPRNTKYTPSKRPVKTIKRVPPAMKAARPAPMRLPTMLKRRMVRQRSLKGLF